MCNKRTIHETKAFTSIIVSVGVMPTSAFSHNYKLDKLIVIKKRSSSDGRKLV